MGAPLAGIEILDLTSGPAGGLATMILADFGARVLRYPDPTYAELDQVPGERVWRRGKETGHASLNEAIAKADVLVITAPNGHNLDLDELHLASPALISATLTAFPGGLPAVPVTEAVVAARLGRMLAMGGILKSPGPRFSAVQVATHAAAQNLATGIMAAVIERTRSGSGQRIETSLAASLCPYDMGGSLAMQHRSRAGESAPEIDPATIMPTLNYHPVQCKDGRWLQLGNLLPHLFASFMRVVGLEDAMAGLPDAREHVRDLILTRMREKTRDEWMALFVADGGIAAHPYQTAEEALDDPDMTENGHVIELSGVRQVGPLARLTRTPAAPGPTAPSPRWQPEATSAPDDAPPLAGITVLELATIIAAPLGASLLADLGARVIKVESIGGDPFRHMAGGFGSLRCNQGIESIELDLKADAGREVLHQLIERSDILIHNYRPGVPERLGFGFEETRRRNPALVYLSANGYGPSGPGALRPSTHPIPGAALGGALCQAGGEPVSLDSIEDTREAARRLMRANEVNPDPNTAMVIATSALLGMLARLRDGEGQHIYGDMFIANAWANHDDFFSFDGKPPRPALGPDLLGPAPLKRLYRCRSGWVCLDIGRREDWMGFCRLTDNERLARRFPEPGLVVNDELASELEAVFAANDAAWFEALLLKEGISCVVADRAPLPAFFYGEAKVPSDYMIEARMPDGTPCFRHRPMIRFSRSRTRAEGPVGPGQHTQTVLRELGYTDEAMNALADAGAIGRT